MKVNLEITIPTARQSVEELIVTEALLGVLHERIHEGGYDVPVLIKDGYKEVKRELDLRLVADRERQLEILKQRRASLATAEEKRSNLDKEIEALQAKIDPPKAASA